MKKMALFTISILLLGFPLTTSTAANVTKPATNYTVPVFEKCLNSAQSECIESVSVTDSSGYEIQGSITSTTSPVGGLLNLTANMTGNLQEWAFPGVKFENGGSGVFIRAHLWQAGMIMCWVAGNCSDRREMIVIDALPTSRGNLGTAYSFRVKMRVPALVKPAFTTAEAQNVKVTVSSLSESTSALSVEFKPLIQELSLNGSHALSDMAKSVGQSDTPHIILEGLQSDQSIYLGPCVRTGGLVVSTNAIDIQPPTWDSANSQIVVPLMAPHLTTSNDPTTGYLEVRIPTEMGKCMWGVNLNGEVQAKISLTYADGTAPVFISVVTKVQDKDFIMVTTGYHYSAPRVGISLQQTPVSAPTPPALSPSPALTTEPTPMASPGSPTAPKSSSTPTLAKQEPVKMNKKTIVCAKGKIKKVISGVSPICPTGYKKV